VGILKIIRGNKSAESSKLTPLERYALGNLLWTIFDRIETEEIPVDEFRDVADEVIVNELKPYLGTKAYHCAEILSPIMAEAAKTLIEDDEATLQQVCKLFEEKFAKKTERLNAPSSEWF